jgi:hypothetical protein
METFLKMLESSTNRARNSNVVLVPVMERWMENCTVRWVMGTYCQLGCVSAEEDIPPQEQWSLSQFHVIFQQWLVQKAPVARRIPAL